MDNFVVLRYWLRLRIKNEQVVAEVVPRSSSVNVRFSFVLNQYQKLEQHMKSLVKWSKVD